MTREALLRLKILLFDEYYNTDDKEYSAILSYFLDQIEAELEYIRYCEEEPQEKE